MIEEVSVVSIESHFKFQRIKKLISDCLKIDLNASEQEVNQLLSKKNESTGILDLRLNSDLMLEIEWNIVEILEDLKLVEYAAMQFPANVRILNNAPKEADVGAYRTTHLHCDSWSGAPQDTLNLFFGIFVSPGAPWLKMYRTFPKHHPAYRYVGAYQEAPVDENELTEVPVPRESGTLVLWPTQTPHKTDMSSPNNSDKEAWRISIDIE